MTLPFPLYDFWNLLGANVSAITDVAQDNVKSSFVDGGAPVGKTTRVDSKRISAMKNEVGGYSIIQADSADAAAKLFGKEQPHLQMSGSWIEISEIMPMSGR